MSVRLIEAPIALSFEKASADEEAFEREYHSLSESDEDPISQWLKLAKARGETADTDPVLLNLMVEMHRKIDQLERLIKNEEPPRVALGRDAVIDRIGYGYFQLKEALLEVGSVYYGRVDMPVHPRRDIGIFFEAETEMLAKIVRIHERDEKEWAAYLTARERVMIREMRGRS